MQPASLPTSPTPDDIPLHVAIIMDGNGRWAKAKGLPRTAGHKKGADSVRETISACVELGIAHLTLYTFSSENWNRPAAEVSDLMGLLRYYLGKELQEMHKQGVRIQLIGDRARLDEDIRQEMLKAEKLTQHNKKLHLSLALSYGSRQEISRAMQKMAKRVQVGSIQPDDIDEHMLEQFLDTAGTPDPDLLIRTGGEQRLSNFLLWQSAYAELYFTDVLWPDFRKADLEKALEAFKQRERRYGTANFSFPSISENLRERIISAVILAPIVLWLVIVGGLAFGTLVVVLAIIMSFEWNEIISTAKDSHTEQQTKRWRLGGILYVGIPCVSLLYLRGLEDGLPVVIWLVCMVWATDIAAFFTGRAVGGPKIAPAISPSKTWAGLAGGMGGSAIVSLFLSPFLPFGMGSLFFIGALMAVISQVGDFGESYIKRRFGVKDSGTIIPGHGGLLDRIDGFTTAAPVLALIMASLGSGAAT